MLNNKMSNEISDENEISDSSEHEHDSNEQESSDSSEHESSDENYSDKYTDRRRSKRLQEKRRLEQGKDKKKQVEKQEVEKEIVKRPQIKRRKTLPPDLFFLIIPPDPNNNEKNNNSKNEEQEEKEREEIIYGPFLPKKRNVKTIKFTKIFETLNELISLGEQYDPSITYICNIDMKKLNKIVNPLKELNNMIGLTKFKKNIIDQLIYILTRDFKNSLEIPMLHSCIYGGPGIGKTTVCKILGKIYAECGLLSKGDLKVAKREDFVGEYLGHTAMKTKKLLESCKGKVLFIDEVYSFGSSKSTNKDMFAKEAVDTLNVFLSENYKDFICIIAGYKEEVESCFFSINEGLKRRFTNTYTIDSYSSKEMCEIFLKFVKDEDWDINIKDKKLEEFFNENIKSFPYYGGDIKTLLDKCKIIHSRRIVMLDKSLWKILDTDDIKDGFGLYLEDRQVKTEENPSHLHMYL